MYLPSAFREDALDVQHDFIRAHPLGVVMTGRAIDGQPYSLSAVSRGEHGVLRLHGQGESAIGRAGLGRRMPGGFSWSAGLCHAVLVRHQGRDAQGRADLEFRCRACVGQAGDPGRSGMVARAAGGVDREPGKARVLPWRVADAPADFIAAQMRAIVGVEIPIARIEGKWKASQNRTPPIGRAWRPGGRGDAVMAGLVARRGGLAETTSARGVGWAPAISRDCHAVGCALRARRPPGQAAYRGRLQQRGGRKRNGCCPACQLRAQQAEQHRREGIGGLRERVIRARRAAHPRVKTRSAMSGGSEVALPMPEPNSSTPSHAAQIWPGASASTSEPQSCTP